MDKLNERQLPPLHPGKHIEEEIFYLGLTKVKAATILGMSLQADYDIWNYMSEHKDELEHIEALLD